MDEPITSPAQVRMLAEGLTDPAPEAVCTPLPGDLEPTRPFSEDRIARAITDPQPYTLGDLRI